MKHYAGLDISKNSISLCIIDENRKIVKETELPNDIDVLSCFLKGTKYEFDKVGLESGSYTHYLTEGLLKEGFDVVVMEARKVSAILSCRTNKTDKNDARGIAEILCSGHYTECVHRSMKAMAGRTLLNGRNTLVKAKTCVSNSIKGLLKPYGKSVCSSTRVDFANEVREVSKDLDESIKMTLESLLEAFELLVQKIKQLDKECSRLVRNDPNIQLLKSMDGVGDVIALAFLMEIDDPKRFSSSRNVPAYLGLTPKQYSSGETQKQGRISKKGTGYTRFLLLEGANALLTRTQAWSDLKAWGIKISRKKDYSKAKVAVARRMAVILHQMLLKQEGFCRSRKKAQAVA